MQQNGGVSYRRILTVKHSTTLSLGIWSWLFLISGSTGIACYDMSYSMSYKELFFLGGLVAVAAAIPLLIGFRRWQTDPRNAAPGFARWEFEAWKEETFLAWCMEHDWYGTEGHGPLELRAAYRANIEDQVRSLDPVELLQWCRENLEKKGFWGTLGKIAAGAFALAADIGIVSLFTDE